MTRVLTAGDIGRVIRTERKRQGITQTQLSELTGIGVSYIGNLERGKETSELGKALTLLTLLGIDVFAQKRGT